MTRVRAKWALVGAVAVLIALAATFVGPRDVEAHAVLERSRPVQGEKLEQAPEIVETWYSEPLERSLTRLEVLDPNLEPVQDGATFFSDDDPLYAAVALPPELPPGIYTVTYENLSQIDGHVWSGFYTFIILEEDGSVPAIQPPPPGGLAGQVGLLPGVADSTLRWIGLLAAVALAGGLFFAFAVARPATEFLDDELAEQANDSATFMAAAAVVAGAALVVVSTAGQLYVLADRFGGPGEIGGILFDTRTGQLWLSRIGLALALLLVHAPALGNAPFRGGRQARLLAVPALIGGAGLLMTYSLASHASAEGGVFWAVASDFAHLAATAAWLGALLQLPLLFWTSRRLREPQRTVYQANALDRFSWVAVVSVVIVIGTGAFNGFVQLPTREALWDTNYGRVLIAKLLLILPLLGVAGLNALYLKPKLVDAIDALHAENPRDRATGAERSQLQAQMQRLRTALPRTIVAELLLGAAVLASVSVLAQSTTADGELRVQATEPAADFVATEREPDLGVELSISPFILGLNTYTVTLEPVDDQELGEVLAVRIIATFDDPTVDVRAGVSGTSEELEPTDDPAVWTGEAALLTQPGDWFIETRVRRRGFNDTSARFFVPEVGGFLARPEDPAGTFDLPFTFVGWDIVTGGAMLALGVGAFLVWNKRPPSWRRATSTSVGLSAAFSMLAGAILVFGVDAHSGFPRENPIEATEESIAIGRDIFMTNCVSCHGETGEGDGPAADPELPPPRLGDHVPFHGDGTLFLWITEGLPLDSETKRMPAWRDTLSDEERWHVVNFLREAFGSGSFTPVLPPELLTPEPEAG